MDTSKIIIKFDTSYIDRENKLHLIDDYIRGFLDQYFPSFETKENIQIILADDVHNTKRRIDEDKSNRTDYSMASTIYLDGQFIVILPIGGFRLEIFPEETKNLSKEFIKSVRVEINHLIYHEIQHIKNRYDYPILAQTLDNVSTISDSYAFFKLSACKFMDEYLATVNSQNFFRTETNDKILVKFEKLHEEMNKKFLEKRLAHQDVHAIAYFYSHVFAISEIKGNTDELTQKIEDKLNGIEKRFFTNMNSAINKRSNKDISTLILEITRIMSDFHRLGSNPKNRSSAK